MTVGTIAIALALGGCSYAAGSTSGGKPPRGPSGADGTYNCADFDTQQQAQDWVNRHGNVDGLDGDGDGVACESLP
jgi:Excalibur calcium-binding domain